MSGLMPPSVSTRKASGTVMSAIRPRHPLRERCVKLKSAILYNLKLRRQNEY